MKPGTCSVLALLAFLSSFYYRLSIAADTLTAGQVLKDWQFLESRNKLFRLGFFYPVHSSNRYLAIRCLDGVENKMVWVANREKPLNDTSGYLNITRDGFLVIGDERGVSIAVINSGSPATGTSNATLVLLDSGNLVLKSGQRVVWQSFDHPTDTILPGMKLGLFDLMKNGQRQQQPRKQFLTSWLGPGVPSSGAFTLGVDPNDTRNFEVLRRGVRYWHGGDWNETEDGYYPFFEESIKIKYTSNENESYFSYTVTKYNVSWIDINPSGKVRSFVGDNNASLSGVAVACDVGKEYRSTGCIENYRPPGCSSEGYEFVYVLGAMEWWELGTDNTSVGLSECEEKCRLNCSCTAYASVSLDGTGCRFSYGAMFNNIPGELKESIHVRNATEQNSTRAGTAPAVSPPISPPIQKDTPKKELLWLKIAGPLAALGLLGLAFLVNYMIRKKRSSKEEAGSRRSQVGWETEQFMHELGSSIAAMDENGTPKLTLKGNKDHELPLFSFSSIETATGHFSEANKVGQGGFGPVFKGTLNDGQEIAVKRLSKRSGQGEEEFKNEVMLISKVQHRNLVRLFGCCIKGEEKILIYEYLPNKSLDTFLFDEKKRIGLDWRMRMNIIEGIAQGILYLHKYSRLKIIHRDLKTSNILLDNNMNPKISDFGTAKIFGENESRANTRRIVGTYGYMSPEYAMDGLYSVKSDVFSFGVMMLEIISGTKNTGFYQTNQSLSLVRHAWNLWKEGKSWELTDPILAETCPEDELTRCVQIALLCVQENAADRPTMSDAVSMLVSNDILPEPKQSSFSTLLRHDSSDLPVSSSVNRVTISSTYAR